MLCVDGFTKGKVEQFSQALTTIRNFSVENNMTTNVHPGTDHTMTPNKENNRSENKIDQIQKIPIAEPVTELVYNMHKNGASLDSISQEMNILRKTVCLHLCKAIENGHPVGGSLLLHFDSIQFGLRV